MTTQRTTPAADPQFVATARGTIERTPLAVGPYAQPAVPGRHLVDAVMIDAIRATIGPFVPAQWRQGSVDTGAVIASGPTEGAAATPTPTVELPWIETFLEAAPSPSIDDETMLVATAPDRDASIEDATAETADSETPPHEGGSPPEGEFAGADAIAQVFAAEETAEDEPAEGTPVDVWPMDEAGAAMRALTDDLRPTTAPRSITPLYVPPVASTPPLPMWGDDDLMDIMPVSTPVAANSEAEHWAATARREAERANNPEAAARALEHLAHRVRAGELELHGYSPELGDAAALAAALAALLGVRR